MPKKEQWTLIDTNLRVTQEGENITFERFIIVLENEITAEHITITLTELETLKTVIESTPKP